MARGSTVNLKLEAAQSALSILRTLLVERLHEDDRKKLDELIDRAERALDEAGNIVNSLRRELDVIADQL